MQSLSGEYTCKANPCVLPFNRRPPFLSFPFFFFFLFCFHKKRIHFNNLIRKQNFVKKEAEPAVFKNVLAAILKKGRKKTSFLFYYGRNQILFYSIFFSMFTTKLDWNLPSQFPLCNVLAFQKLELFKEIKTVASQSTWLSLYNGSILSF